MPDRSQIPTSGWLHRRRDALALLLLFSLAFGLRLFYLDRTAIYVPIRADAREYYTYAVNLIQRGIYSSQQAPDLAPDAHRTPGYPLFLAAFLYRAPDFTTAYHRILAAQALLGALTALVAFGIGRLVLPFGLALTAGLLTALSPHLVAVGGYVLTETLFALLAALAMLVLCQALRRRRVVGCFAASVLLGLASLVRPALLLFPLFLIPLIPWLMPRQKRWPAGLALVAGVVLTWLPWQMWTACHVPVRNGGGGLAAHSFVTGSYPDMVFQDPRFRGYPNREDPQYPELVAQPILALQTVWHRALTAPWTYLRWYLVGKPSLFWSWDILQGQGDIYIYPVLTSLYQTNPAAAASRTVMRALHPLLLALGGPGLVWACLVWDDRSRRMMSLTILGLLAYFTLVHMVLTPLPRYSIPLRPELFVGAMVPIGVAYEIWRRRRNAA